MTLKSLHRPDYCFAVSLGGGLRIGGKKTKAAEQEYLSGGSLNYFDLFPTSLPGGEIDVV